MEEDKHQQSVGGLAGGKTGAAPGEHTANAHRGSSTVSLGQGRVAANEKKAAVDQGGEGSHSGAGLALARACSTALGGEQTRHVSVGAGEDLEVRHRSVALARSSSSSSTHPGASNMAVLQGETTRNARRRSVALARSSSSTHPGASDMAVLQGETTRNVALGDRSARHGSVALARSSSITHPGASNLAVLQGKATRNVALGDKSARHRSGAPMKTVAPAGESIPVVVLGGSSGRDEGGDVTVAQGGEAIGEKMAADGDGASIGRHLASTQQGSSASVAMNQIMPRAPLPKKAVRAQCRDALQMHKNGGTTQAVIRAEALAIEYPQYSFTNNLAGELCQAVGSKTMARLFGREITDVFEALDVTARYYNLARQFYGAAAALAPRCIATAVSRSKMLVACEKLGAVNCSGVPQEAVMFGVANLGAAQAELRRAIDIADADNPADHNVRYDIDRETRDRVRSTPRMRIQIARGEAREEQNKFQDMICLKHIPAEIGWLWTSIESDQDLDGRLLGLAANFFHLYPFCSRVHILHARLELKRANTMEEEGHRAQVIGQLKFTLNHAAGCFRESIVIALLCAEVALMLDQCEEALEHCSRGLSIINPTDPWLEDVPVHSTEGCDLNARICHMKNALQDLTASSAARCAAIAPATTETSSAEAPKTMIQSSNRKYAFRYGYKKRKPRDPSQAPFVCTVPVPNRVLVTYPAYRVCGEYVPQEIVNLFKDYCRTLSRCPSSHTPCHICCFEGAWCSVVHKELERVHFYGKHGQDYKVTIDCKEDNCTARLPRMKDFRQHHYFVHQLPGDWWEQTD